MIKEMARKLRKARKDAGLSQADVAHQLGLSAEGYGHMERGTRAIGMEYFLQLSSILGCRITDLLPDSWVTDENNRLTYSALRCLIQRRAARAGVKAPSLHSFRRAFALLSLRAGMDVYSLQKLMGHADLTVLRRYLAQTEDDLREAHQKAGLVDRLL